MGRHMAVLLDAREGGAHGAFHRVMGDEDEGCGGARLVLLQLAALEDLFESGFGNDKLYALCNTGRYLGVGIAGYTYRGAY